METDDVGTVGRSGGAAPRQRLGQGGEQLARELLVRRGLVILDANWRCRIGELDLVALDGDDLVFVEVKTRRSTAFGHPAEAVTARKLARLRQLAGAWIAEHEVRAAGLRIDVVAILDAPGQPVRVEHLRGVG